METIERATYQRIDKEEPPSGNVAEPYSHISKIGPARDAYNVTLRVNEHAGKDLLRIHKEDGRLRWTFTLENGDVYISAEHADEPWTIHQPTDLHTGTTFTFTTSLAKRE